MLAIATGLGRSQLVALDLATGAATPLDLPFVEYAGVGCAGGRAIAQALPDDGPAAIGADRPPAGRRSRRAARSICDPALIARAEHVSFRQ